MTKKDFELIAHTLKREYIFDRDVTPVNEYLLFRRICDNFVETLSQTNERFDRDRFLTACGFTE